MNPCLVFILFALVLAEDDDLPKGGRGGQRGCSFPNNIPSNIIIRMQGRGRIIRYICPSRSILVGKKFSTCLKGRWSSPPPICINRGCALQTAPSNGRVTETYDGGMLVFGCNPGYVQNGTSTIYCDGYQWNATAPTCTVPTMYPNVSCDFEDPGLCGWTDDVTHDFEWKRHKFSTPSGHVGTGPSFDHTKGKGLDGYYMYLEASSPRKEGETARLFSPIYPTVLSGACFTFWFHMYGETIGSLRVYLKGENQVLDELNPLWNQEGEKGNVWMQGQIDVPQLTTVFQLIIEGVRGNDYTGDIAIDDVNLNPGPCPAQKNVTAEGSCHTFGCSIQEGETSRCGCSADCETSNSCCSDYWAFCLRGNRTDTAVADEGGGQNNQNFTETKTTVITQMAVTTESSVGGTVSLSSGNSTKDDSGSITTSSTSLYPSTNTNSQTEISGAKTEITTEHPKVPHTDCVIDESNSTQTDQNWIISLSNCSTSSKEDVPNATELSRSTDIIYETTTPPINITSFATTTVTPSAPKLTTISAVTKSNTEVNVSTLNVSTQLPSTTTKSKFIPKFTKITTVVRTTPTQLTTVVKTTPTPLTTVVRTTPTPLTTTARSTVIVPKTPTPTVAQTSTVHSTITTSSPSTTTTESIPTTSSSSVVTADTTTVAITSPTTARTTSTTITSSIGITTKKSFIWIIPKTNQTVTASTTPLTSSTQAEVKKHTTASFITTTNVPAEVPKTVSTTKTVKPFLPKKETTTTTTTDIDRLFPEFPGFPDNEDDSRQTDDDHSGQQEDDSTLKDEAIVKDGVAFVSDMSVRGTEFPRRSNSRKKSTSGAGVSAVVTACVLGALVLLVSGFTVYFFVIRRQRLKRRRGSDSEIRFISQNEELEISLADNTESIKLL